MAKMIIKSTQLHRRAYFLANELTAAAKMAQIITDRMCKRGEELRRELSNERWEVDQDLLMTEQNKLLNETDAEIKKLIEELYNTMRASFAPPPPPPPRPFAPKPPVQHIEQTEPDEDIPFL